MMKFQSLKDQCGQAVFCPWCQRILDCNDAVSWDVTSNDKLLKTFVCCGTCSDKKTAAQLLEALNGNPKLREVYGDSLRVEQFDGREYDSDGHPLEVPAVGAPISIPRAGGTYGGILRQEVMGNAVAFPGFEKFKFGVYKWLDAEEWSVVEMSTGLSIGAPQPTQRAALIKASLYLSKVGKRRFAAGVRRALEAEKAQQALRAQAEAALKAQNSGLLTEVQKAA
jgi:hypothetical protein